MRKKWTQVDLRDKWTAALIEGRSTPEARAKMSKSALEVGTRPEIKAGRSRAVREAQARPETKAQRCKLSQELWTDPAYRERFAAGLAEAMARPEVKAKLSKAALLRWANPQYRDGQIRALRIAQHVRPNKPEQQLLGLLNDLYPNEWKYTGDGSFIIGGLNPDFVNINGKKQVIEMFGDWWHSDEQLKLIDRLWKGSEMGRMMIFNSYGYQSLIVWERELRDIPTLTKRIRAFHKSKLASHK